MKRRSENAGSAGLAIVLAVALPSCRGHDNQDTATLASDSARPVTTAGPVLLRGLIPARARTAVVPCGSTDTLQLRDPSAALAAAADTGTLFVVLAGQRTAPGQFTIDQVLYTSPERFECFTDWSGFAYRATGQNPGWVAEVAGDQLVLRLEGGATFTWSGLQKDSTADRVRFSASAAAGQPVQLTLQRQACRNPVSRALSAWSATLLSGPDRLQGCAVPGVP